MGWVFLAFDGDLGRRVAIKWLKPAGGEALERLAREAHLHARVEHPAVCRLYHLGDHQGRPYLVLQLVRGETLDKAAPRLPVPVRVRLVATLANGVHAAHRQGLVHRDLKPANCMVEMDEAGGTVAIEQLNGKDLGGRAISVNAAHARGSGSTRT
jgi:serine/threonine-protein kinase